MTNESPLEIALRQLAQNMGVQIPISVNKEAASPVQEPSFPKSNEQSQHVQFINKGTSLPSVESEEEEGEISEDEPLPAAKSNNRKRAEGRDTQRKDGPKGSRRVVPSSASESAKIIFTGNVDAESLLRGPPVKRSRPVPSTVKKNQLAAHQKASITAPSESVFLKSIQPNTKPGKVPCKYWMKGKCAKGDNCTFSHVQKPNKTPEEAKSQEVCKFHIAGTCLKGDVCLFSHDLSKVPCRFFHLRGDCSAGIDCRFSHASISEEIRHAMFLEINGGAGVVRDPRLNKTDPPAGIIPPVPAIANTVLLPHDPHLIVLTVGGKGTDAIRSFNIPVDLDPRVLKYNPFGSAFK